jgi:hypothetical protein
MLSSVISTLALFLTGAIICLKEQYNEGCDGNGTAKEFHGVPFEITAAPSYL